MKAAPPYPAVQKGSISDSWLPKWAYRPLTGSNHPKGLYKQKQIQKSLKLGTAFRYKSERSPFWKR